MHDITAPGVLWRVVRLTLVSLTLAALLPIRPALASEIKMAGDVRMYGNFFSGRDFTGWNEDGTQTADDFMIWQRLRWRSDFVANENLSFRLGIKVDDTPWGSGTLTAANPEPALLPYLAYLQFKWPDTEFQVTAGYQPVSMPWSSPFYDSLVLAADDGDSPTAALVVSTPLAGETLGATAGFIRLTDANRTYDPTTTQVDDEFDAYFLSLPLKVDGFTATPWAMAGVVGKDSDPDGIFTKGMTAAGSYLDPPGYRNNQNSAWWAGLTTTIDAIENWRLSADFAYGAAAPGDKNRNQRRGWFVDAGIHYTGLDYITPGILAWAGSGEDASIMNGSERLPVVLPKWGAGTSFLFDCDQAFGDASMALDPTGSMGIALHLNDISFVESLKHRLTIAYMAGQNSSSGLRKAVLASGGSGPYVRMGRNLAVGESALGINFDHEYEIMENLSLVAELGFAKGFDFQKSVWGRRMVNAYQDGWKAGFGFLYEF